MPKTHKSIRRSDNPNDKRRNPKNRHERGKHLGTTEQWLEATQAFMENKDYYVNRIRYDKYIDNKIIYHLAVREHWQQFRLPKLERHNAIEPNPAIRKEEEHQVKSPPEIKITLV